MIYQKLIFSEIELIKKIENITLSDYEIKGDYNEFDKLMTINEDLFFEYESLKEKFEDLENDIKDNYRKIPIEEQV